MSFMKEAILRDYLSQHDTMGDVLLGTLLPYYGKKEVTFNLYAQSKFGIQCHNKFGMTFLLNMCSGCNRTTKRT